MALASLVGVVALYAFLGFVVAPVVVRNQILERVGALTERPVSVERVRVNPFARSVTVEGFLVKNRDGAPLASFDRLYARVALGGLLQKELGLAEFLLDRPYLHPSLDVRGQLNVSDIVARLGAEDRDAAARTPGEGVSFVIGHLRISDAKVDFSDRSRRSPFETSVGPFTLDLRNFRTNRRDNQSPYTLAGTTESGESFSWSGNVRIEPIRSNGTFSFERLRLPKYAPYYQDATSAEIRKGTLDFKATYELEWGAGRRVVRIVDGSIVVADLALGPRVGGEPAVGLTRLEVKGLQSDVLTGEAGIGLVALEGGQVRVRREPGGEIDLVALLRPPATASAAPEAQGSAGAAKAPRFRLEQLSVQGVRVDVEDAATDPPVQVRVDVDRLQLQGLSNDPAATATLDASLRVDGSGKVSAKGAVRPLRPAADLDVEADALGLPRFAPYLSDVVDARLEEALLGAKGHASYDGAATPAAWAFHGDVRLDGLRMADGRKGEEVLRWKSLRLEGVDASPGRTALRAVRLVSPRLRVAIWEDKVRNLDVVARRAQAPQAASTAASTAASPAQAWSIGLLQVADGRVTLVDRSLTPAATAEITDLAVAVRGLSSEPRSSARVEADARIGGAPLSVSGTLQPRFLGDATDLVVRSHAIDLTPVGPYVAKYAGYELQKGKLDLDLRYAVRARTLEAENRARIDQFTLGEERPGPDVTSLPVKLGLAILRDRDGVVELDVPVSGSIDDPDFSIGRMVWRAVGNVFTKLVTAPFVALGKLFGGGGGEDLERVEFASGGAGLDPGAERTLGVLAKALRERPALRLEVEGVSSEAADGAALRREQASLAVRRARWTALRARQPGLVLDDVAVPPEEYPRWLAAAFAALPPPAPAPGAAPQPKDARPPPGPEEMEAALAAAAVVPPEAYAELAARRADAARDRLLAGGEVDPARVFVTAGGERARKEGGARAYFTLR